MKKVRQKFVKVSFISLIEFFKKKFRPTLNSIIAIIKAIKNMPENLIRPKIPAPKYLLN